MNKEFKEYRFLWFIENYSYCWHEIDERLVSPDFTADGLDGTAWNLLLYPGGEEDYTECISFYLNRSEDNDDGPKEYNLNYKVSVLAADGSALHAEEYNNTFTKDAVWGEALYVPMDEILLRRKSDYLPNDILSVCAVLKVKKIKGSIQNTKEIWARTRIGTEHISFRHEVERFSFLKPNVKKTVQIKYAEKGHSLTCNVYIGDDSCCQNKIIVQIKSINASHFLSRCKLYLLDESEKKVQCGEANNQCGTTRNDNQKVTLSLTKTYILKRKRKLLPNDKLILLCDCVFSTGIEFEKIERTLQEFYFEGQNQMIKSDENIFSEKLSACPSGLDDLITNYSQRLLTDIELKTKTTSFPAHKFLLCARSSVFQAMLTNDMREKNTDIIEIDDLEDDIVKQLLFFLYSDRLENLNWEYAIKLYYAADKYAIEKLKLTCASFLVRNLSISKASELLLLADNHHDSDLKKLVEDFIFKHDQEVFSCNEWGNLLEANSILVSATMRLKYMKEL